jgi:acetylornithine deacetylase
MRDLQDTTAERAEQGVRDAIRARREDLVELTRRLVAFDTTARTPTDPPRDEAALQAYLADRLRAAGAAVDVWEPAPEDLEGSRQVRGGLSFDGRPQLVATFAGGDGRRLLLNGHIDVVSAEPRDRWTSDPFEGVVRDGRIYGRGTADMKGGIASMVIAAETLAGLGIRLGGDLLVNTVTDEESTGAGGIAAVAHGVRADAGIVPEPTDFDVWVACRGTVRSTIVVEGRPDHAQLAQPHWRAGGAVNAIEKATVVLDAMRRWRDEWRGRPGNEHPYLSPCDIVPTMIAGGEWQVSYPAVCRIQSVLMYLPGQSDASGWGTDVEREFERWIERAAAADPWLAEHPPRVEWEMDVPATEVGADHPIVAAVLEATADVGRPGAPAGLDSWFDGATFTRFADTPSVAYGPGRPTGIHTVDESVEIEDLVHTAQAIAVAAMRFCGVEDGVA